MKSLKILSLLAIFGFFSGLNAMEEGIEEGRKEREEAQRISRIQAAIKLPKGIWQEIAKVGINIHASTKAEMFKLTDKLKSIGGKTELTIINLVKTYAIKKYQNVFDPQEKAKLINEYNYGKFKNDIYENIFNEWDQKINNEVRENATEQEKFAAASDLGAKIWLRKQIPLQGFPENMEFPEARLRLALIRLVYGGKLVNTKMIALRKLERKNIEYLLKLGAKLDIASSSREVFSIAIQFNIDVDLVKLLIAYGANPLLIENGQNSLDFAKKYLLKLEEENKKTNQGLFSWMTGKTVPETEDIKKIKAIIKIFEDYKEQQSIGSQRKSNSKEEMEQEVKREPKSETGPYYGTL